MRKLLFALLLLSSCATYKASDFTYQFKMTTPVKSDKLVYEDNLVSIAFDVAPRYIRLMLMNPGQDPIKIIWDDAAFVKDGKSQKIFHSGMYVKNVYKEATPPTIIPGHTTIKESVGPADHIKYNAMSEEWVMDPIFLASKRLASIYKVDVKENIGKEFKLLLPIEINGKEKYYTFTFVVTNIYQAGTLNPA